ncbi:hypothetical protein NDS46_27975 [Paenibacillus thiaminolyticus]|uniref:hypothetical protein n=1 Tax=Paenibacillus thiaminolyticus TaxID=49283 RepID=UPI00232B8ABA|nr:hypothetical protein [Paenibacillus thiaminolyticus]WCF08053.1 hypothetical protein NDS46_27975 [Paenibacillus thiaminolyticus]
MAEGRPEAMLQREAAAGFLDPERLYGSGSHRWSRTQHLHKIFETKRLRKAVMIQYTI